MKIRKLLIIFLALSMFGTSKAGQVSPSNSATQTIQETDSPPLSQKQEVRKVSIINKAEIVLRCESNKLLKCLKMSVEQCKLAVSSATDVANSEIEKEAGGKVLAELEQGFFRGRAHGSFIVEMQKNTKGKFLSCLQKT